MANATQTKIPNLTVPYLRALTKVANAGIGHPGTARKVERLTRWGLIRHVRNTTGYELTALGAATLNKSEQWEAADYIAAANLAAQ